VPNYAVFGSEPSHTPGMTLWQDPRTGLYFSSESEAKALGYGQPVDNANTITQVGSQGSFTADGRLVTNDMLTAPGADNAGYVDAARWNLKNNVPTSSAAGAANWINDYVRSPVYQSNQTTPAGAAGTNDGMTVSPTAVLPAYPQSVTQTQASAAADPNTNTGALTSVGGFVQTLAGYSSYILIGLVVVIAAIIFLGKKAGVKA
jgi:hypothetical protein